MPRANKKPEGLELDPESAAGVARQKRVDALKVELEGYERRGLSDRAAAVRSDLANYGHKVTGRGRPPLSTGINPDPSKGTASADNLGVEFVLDVDGEPVLDEDDNPVPAELDESGNPVLGDDGLRVPATPAE